MVNAVGKAPKKVNTTGGSGVGWVGVRCVCVCVGGGYCRGYCKN